MKNKEILSEIENFKNMMKKKIKKISWIYVLLCSGIYVLYVINGLSTGSELNIEIHIFFFIGSIVIWVLVSIFYNSYSKDALKLNLLEKKVDPDSLYSKLVKVYKLATDNQLNIINKTIEINILSLNSSGLYNGTSVAEEYEAIKDVYKEREKKEDNFLKNMNEQCSEEDIYNLLHIWINNFESPDIIKVRLVKMLDNKYPKLVISIMKITDNFINEYENNFNKSNNSIKKQNDFINEKYMNRPTEGLGFSVISTSISQQVAYSALDTYERNKELRENACEASRIADYCNKASAERLYDSIMKLYRRYSKEIDEAVKKYYIIKNKEK